MNAILEQNREGVREVGRRLMEIGAVLVEGKMDEARTRAAIARANLPRVGGAGSGPR